MEAALKGMFLGILLGAFAGLGVCIWVLTETLFFSGDTMLIGDVIGGVGGFIGGLVWGEDFVDWFAEHWHRFL